MAIKIVNYNMFESPMQTLVNPVNLRGIMDDGISIEFKTRYPKMYQEYLFLCRRREFKIGMLYLWRSSPHMVLNFPIKKSKHESPKIEYIEAGLKKLADKYKEQQIYSISFPMFIFNKRGKIKWDDVKNMIISYLDPLDMDVLIHEFTY